MTSVDNKRGNIHRVHATMEYGEGHAVQVLELASGSGPLWRAVARSSSSPLLESRSTRHPTAARKQPANAPITTSSWFGTLVSRSGSGTRSAPAPRPAYRDGTGRCAGRNGPSEPGPESQWSGRRERTTQPYGSAYGNVSALAPSALVVMTATGSRIGRVSSYRVIGYLWIPGRPTTRTSGGT